MKKILLSILPLVAVLFLGACSDSEDEVAKKYVATVNVELPDAYTWNDIEDAKVILKNQATAAEFVAVEASEGVYKADVTAGEYSVSISLLAKDGKMLNFSKNLSVYGDTSVEAETVVAQTSPLVFKEIYAAMCKTPANKNYMQDQFYEIYNNSEFTVYLDNCILARTEGAANNINNFWGEDFPSTRKVGISSYVAAFVSDSEKPGTTYPLAPGETMLVAWSALDHVNVGEEPNTNTVDLSGADYEINISSYNAKYVGSPDVPDLAIVEKPGTQKLVFGMVPAFGCGLVLAKVDDVQAYIEDENNWGTKPSGTDTNPYLMINYDDIQDAVNIVSPAENQRAVFLGAEIDGGYIYPSAMYCGKSFTRKVKETVNGRVVYQDTNNSANDFEPEAVPTPGI